ncbi:flagellar basal-body MS-ring/collar protein FliF [Acidithrix ferrooxidans]|uniref:Flagellar M-ring protein n=1 Tax=Acidithrix ferrooxidans TaxID=1280514 RepID=A0A0D8HF20_9ACTN|nr:flagellar basal-body MS-ring/collar protein FliF [Acidithrix ferrooxidans]KJF16565.1 flagellar M-ring protein [Acidithrix ferrooxidans]
MAVSDSVGSLRQYGVRFANGFTSGQKVLTVLAIAALALGGFVYSQYASKPSYAPLFTGLAASDAAAMTAKLQAAGVPYQIADGGATIMVPQPDVYQQRLNMAQANLPANSTVGLAILDKVGITASQLTQQADYQRALQGELASTIEAIQGVTAAQVNLALVSNNVFAISNTQQPSASVLVTLATGTVLSATQIQGIVHLVASSIPNLSASNITLVDSNGNVLSAPGMNTASSTNSAATTAYDQNLQTALESLLTPLVGANNAVVRVAATLNFNQVTTQSQAVQTNPKGTPITVPTQVQTATQNFSGTGSPTGGVLGSITTNAATGAANSTYQQTNNTTNYALGQINQSTTQAPGQVQRLSVAVLLNSKVKGVTPARVSQLVSAAAGIVAARGDTISVVQMPFSALPKTTPIVGASSASSLYSLIKTALLVLGVILAMFFVIRSSKKEVRAEIDIPAYSDYYDEIPEAQVRQLPPAEAPMISTEIVSFIESQPEDVAKLLRVWMTSAVKAG